MDLSFSNAERYERQALNQNARLNWAQMRSRGKLTCYLTSGSAKRFLTCCCCCSIFPPAYEQLSKCPGTARENPSLSGDALPHRCGTVRNTYCGILQGELRRVHCIKIKRNCKKLAFNFSSAQLCEKRREQKGGESWLK